MLYLLKFLYYINYRLFCIYMNICHPVSFLINLCRSRYTPLPPACRLCRDVARPARDLPDLNCSDVGRNFTGQSSLNADFVNVQTRMCHLAHSEYNTVFRISNRDEEFKCAEMKDIRASHLPGTILPEREYRCEMSRNISFTFVKCIPSRAHFMVLFSFVQSHYPGNDGICEYLFML